MSTKWVCFSIFLKGTIPTIGEGGSTSQTGGSAQTPTPSEGQTRRAPGGELSR